MFSTSVVSAGRRMFPIRCLSHSKTFTHDSSQVKYSSISECYAGKSVFITGGTGFLGKVLIERLLHNCSDIDKIYVLIREKKGINTDKRLQQMLDVPLFEKLKQKKPEALNKIVAVGGDITRKELGIKPADEQQIVDNVSIVFHSAASVKFVDPFEDILNINYEGTKRVVKLSKKIKKLETFMHISTTFSNADKLIIDEYVYPPARRDEEVYSFLENHGDNPQELKKFLRGLPNTYTFSKSLSESYVKENHGHMPTIIFRPAIVTPILHEPLPGWLDSWVATSALYSDISRGLTKVLYGHDDVICDMIPVDYVCNLAIVAAARGNQTNDVVVYNSCSGTVNPISWKGGADLYLEEGIKHGGSELPPSKVRVFKSEAMVKFAAFLLQTVPAFVADLKLRMAGGKPRQLDLQKRAVLLRELLNQFMSTSVQIKSTKALELISTLSEEDKVRFPCDARNISWKKYMPVYYRGVQKYMLKNKH